jgi:hypothetical protein
MIIGDNICWTNGGKYTRCRTCRNYSAMIAQRAARKTAKGRIKDAQVSEVRILTSALAAVDAVSKQIGANKPLRDKKPLVAWVTSQITYLETLCSVIESRA